MGLDMYAEWFDPSDVIVDEDGEIKTEQFAYWRKHNALHGWFEDLYRSKGGEDEFNCVHVDITLEDLDELEKGMQENSLIPSGGFFFGSTDYDVNEYKEEDTAFIDKGRELLSKGMKISYSSWW